jgi:drug/metabolite transporter, DME family
VYQDRRLFLIGALCGLAAAIGYTVTNVCLRQVSQLDPFFVSLVRAIPSTVIVAPMLLWRTHRGLPLRRGMNHLGWLVLAGTIAQICGNVFFQSSLGVVGVAIAVPLVLSTMIVSGAIIGRLFLGERVGLQTQLGMAMLIVALIFFSMGAKQAQMEIHSGQGSATSQVALILAIAGNLAGGLSYAFLGLCMRRAFQSGMTIDMAILILSVVGIVLLSFICFFRITWVQFQTITASDWMLMIVAGFLNGFSFLLLSVALRNLHLVFAQMVNATQATLASIAGFLIFAEPFTNSLLLGLLFTIAGLAMAGLQKRPVGVQVDEPKA